MSVPSSEKQGSEPSSSSLPSEVFRGLVSIAICLYLLGFALTVAGNSASGSSALVRTVKTKMFSPWMVPLWLDIGFDYRLTYGQFNDADHLIEVRPWSGDSETRVQFPAAGSTSIAANRWRTFAAWLEPETVPEEFSGILPTALAESLFDEMQTEDLRVRSLRVAMPERANFSARDADDPPQLQQVSATRVRRVAGSIQMLPVEEQRDVAPLSTPQPAPSAAANEE